MGTVGSIMLGMVIMITLMRSSTSFSLAERVSTRSASAPICAFTFSASSFSPFAISAPICLESLFLCALSASTSCLMVLFSLSSTRTSSTRGSFASWNFLRMFSFTISGFSLTNLMSNISWPPKNSIFSDGSFSYILWKVFQSEKRIVSNSSL